MRFMKWFGFLGAVLLIIACLQKWVIIASRNIVITGIDATGTSFGKPAYFHFILVFLFLIFHFTPRIWAKRGNLIVAAINMAWAIRNYLIITMCRGGDCPEKQTGIYLIVIASFILLLAALFPDMKIRKQDTIA